MEILILLNIICIIHIYIKLYGIKFEITKTKTWHGNKVTAYNLLIWRKKNSFHETVFTFKIPIANHKKVSLQEEIMYMISKCNEQSKRQKLTAMFSWLKTPEEVEEFKKNYTVVDQEYVEELVSGFRRKSG